MKILFISDVESKLFWDFFRKEFFEDIDLIISCGDLKASYLSFLATMTNSPVFYIHGNHDDDYAKNEPEGCECIDGKLVTYQGLRILGLGGSNRYKPGVNQYTEKQMERRVRKLKRTIQKNKGFDILVTHAPAHGTNDGEDMCHVGFKVFKQLVEEYSPKVFAHGHVHMNYGRQIPRTDYLGSTMVINAYEKMIIEI